MDEEVLKHPAGVEGQELQPGALSRKRRCPNRSNQELSSGALRGEVDGDNLSEEGTRNESRNCTKESDHQTRNGVSPVPAGNMNRECENKKRKRENLSQASKITPFLELGSSLNPRPSKKPCLSKTKNQTKPNLKLLKSFDKTLLSKPPAALSRKEKLILKNYYNNSVFMQNQNVITSFFKPTSVSFVTCEKSLKSESSGVETYKPSETSPALSRTPKVTNTNAASNVLEKGGTPSPMS